MRKPRQCLAHLAEDYDDDTVAFGEDPNEKDQSDTVSSSSPSIGIRSKQSLTSGSGLEQIYADIVV